MIVQTPWFDRKFQSGLPAGLFPCLVERLRGTPIRIEALISGIDEMLLNRKPDNSWSIKEHIGHMADLEALHDGRIEDYLAGKKLLRATDLQNKATDEADHNSKSIAALLHYFRQVRMNFIEKVEQLDDQMLNAVSVHPRLQQPMNLVDMVSFVCEHDDHHLAKMRRLLKNG